jgi:DNA-binding NarL/FixJ family response regulator
VLTVDGRGVIDVLLADDEELLRAGLRMILDGEEGIRVSGEARDGVEAVNLARLQRPDIVLMDIQMPVMDGIEATRRIVSDHDGPQVLVLTTFERDDYVAASLRAGAAGFLLKNAPPDEIVAFVRSERPDLVVISPGGRRSRLLPGPTDSEQIVRHAGVATLAARAPAEGKLPQRIVLAVIDDAHAEEALGWLSRAGWLRGSEIMLVGLPVSIDRAALGTRADGEGAASEPVSADGLRRLARLAAAQARSGGVDRRLLPVGRPVEGLLALLSAMASDLVVVPKPSLGMRDELTETVCSASTVSVLVLPVSTPPRDQAHDDDRVPRDGGRRTAPAESPSQVER